MDFSSRTKALRKARGLTQKQLARRSGLTLKAISGLERGRVKDPHISTLMGISSGLGVSLSEFLNG